MRRVDNNSGLSCLRLLLCTESNNVGKQQPEEQKHYIDFASLGLASQAPYSLLLVCVCFLMVNMVHRLCINMDVIMYEN